MNGSANSLVASRAERQKAILEYWIHRNNSATYSKKLDVLFRKAVKLIAEFPFIGSPTTIEEVRIKSVGDYLTFYEESEDRIHVLTIWDRRRDPETSKLT